MSTEERLIERVRKFLKTKGVTAYEFEKKIEVANGYLNKQAAGKGTVGSEALEKIHRQYPNLDILWLLTGEGEMEISSSKMHTQDAHPNAHPKANETGDGEDFSLLIERQKMNETLVEVLKQQNATLQASNADKDKIIAMLEEQLKAGKTKGK